MHELSPEALHHDRIAGHTPRVGFSGPRVAKAPRKRREKRVLNAAPPTAAERAAALVKAESYERLLEMHRRNTEEAVARGAAFASDDPAGRSARHEAAVRVTFYEKWLEEYRRARAVADSPDSEGVR